MRILAVYPYLPWPLDRGAYHRAYHLLKGLGRAHEVHLLALSENSAIDGHVEIFREFCQTVRVIPFQHPPWQRLFPQRILNKWPSTVAHWTVPEVAIAIQEALRSSDYDAIHVLDLVLVQYFLRVHPQIPLVLDRTRVDLQYQLMEQARSHPSLKTRLLNLENQAKLWVFEKKVAHRCSLEVVCGPDDEAFIRKYISKTVPVEVLPNGVDLDFFRPESVDAERDLEPTVIFCGAMDYAPNVDALRWFFSEMHEPLRQAVADLKVLVVGKNPTSEVQSYSVRRGVTVTGGVPDVRSYYKRAWLKIDPLRICGGTRLKIVESLGMRTPVVSTRIGAQGLNLRDGSEVIYADSADLFVRETARALRDPLLRQRLEAEGASAAAQRLSWHTLSQRLVDVYQKWLPQPCQAIPRPGTVQLESVGNVYTGNSLPDNA